MDEVSQRLHTDGVIAALEAVDELNVGDATGKDLPLPYAVVYAIPGGDSSGTLERPDEDAELVYQVTCVGKSRRQAEWAVDKAMSALLDGFAVEGREITRVWVDSFGGIRRDDDATPPLFSGMPRFRVKTTPAPDVP